MPLHIPVKTVLGLNEEMEIALKEYSSCVVDTQTNTEGKHQDSLSRARLHEELHFVIKQIFSSSASLT